MKQRLRDPAILFMLDQLRKENESLPPNKRMGLQAYLRKHGIISREKEQSIRHHEVPFSFLTARERSQIGEWAEGDDE